MSDRDNLTSNRLLREASIDDAPPQYGNSEAHAWAAGFNAALAADEPKARKFTPMDRDALREKIASDPDPDPEISAGAAVPPSAAPLELALQQVMARLADLLGEDQFNNIEAIVREAGVRYPDECVSAATKSDAETIKGYDDKMNRAAESKPAVEKNARASGSTEAPSSANSVARGAHSDETSTSLIAESACPLCDYGTCRGNHPELQ